MSTLIGSSSPPNSACTGHSGLYSLACPAPRAAKRWLYLTVMGKAPVKGGGGGCVCHTVHRDLGVIEAYTCRARWVLYGLKTSRNAIPAYMRVHMALGQWSTCVGVGVLSSYLSGVV